MAGSPRQQPARPYVFALLSLFALGIQSLDSPAQSVVSDSDCATLKPEQSALGYRRVRNRCEGFYLPSLSARLQVVSFIPGSRIEFSWAEDTQLIVTPVKATSEPLHVRAVSLQRNVFYRMDAVLEPGAALSWPIRPFVFPREIRPDQLGVYGWAGDEYDKTFLPVRVREENSNDQLPGSLRLKIRTVLDLTHFRWALVEPANDVCHAQPGVDAFRYYEGDMNAGAIIDLEIPGVIANTGDSCLEIQYRPNNQRWMAEKIKIRI